jgi:hypothetical protein
VVTRRRRKRPCDPGLTVAGIDDDVRLADREGIRIAAIALTVLVDVELIGVVRPDAVVARIVDAVVVGVHQRAMRLRDAGGRAREREGRRSDQQKKNENEEGTPLVPRHSS